MTRDFATLRTEIGDALKAMNWSAADSLARELGVLALRDPAQIPLKEANDILNGFRRKRRFAAASLLAQTLIHAINVNAKTHRILAQAFIDQGQLYAADAVLQGILDRLSPDDFERGEVCGLRGRIYKQLYVNANRDGADPAGRQYLEKALQFYEQGFDNKVENFWHGINALAVADRAARDGITVEVNPTMVAAKLRQFLESKASDLTAQSWLRGTLVECYVALRQTAKAIQAAQAYVDPNLQGDANADAFEIASTLRQLEELWCLNVEEEPGKSVLPILRSALLKREGSALTLTAAQAKTQLETVTANDPFNNVKWYQDGLDRCQSIARIVRKGGLGIGTGWIVRASDFYPAAAANETLLITNAHVIPAVSHQIAEAQFEMSGETIGFDSVFDFSPVDEGFDCCFLKLKSVPAKAKPVDILPFDKTLHERAYVIGHPFGANLSFSLQNSNVAGSNKTLLHYHTSTAEGSSGSPVFEQHEWRAIALHHGANPSLRLDGSTAGEYKVNEGILLSAIQAAIAQKGKLS